MPLGEDAHVTPFDEPWEYASVVGMLMHLSVHSKPDIQFAVHQCSRFNQNPRRSHDESVKRICRYLVVIQGQGLTFDPNGNMKLD